MQSNQKVKTMQPLFGNASGMQTHGTIDGKPIGVTYIPKSPQGVTETTQPGDTDQASFLGRKEGSTQMGGGSSGGSTSQMQMG